VTLSWEDFRIDLGVFLVQFGKCWPWIITDRI